MIGPRRAIDLAISIPLGLAIDGVLRFAAWKEERRLHRDPRGRAAARDSRDRTPPGTMGDRGRSFPT